MRTFILTLAVLGLILTVVPSFFVFFGRTSWEIHSRLMIIGMVLWFVFAPIAMKEKVHSK
ncbi:MAG: hypothetical protein ABIL68_01610 [bacterium]